MPGIRKKKHYNVVYFWVNKPFVLIIQSFGYLKGI